MMSDPDDRPDRPDQSPSGSAERDERRAADGTPARGETADPLAVLQREVEQLRDRNLRLAAEVQNQQKRAAREREEVVRYAEADFARALLVVLDDLERTQQSAPAGAAAAALAEGIRIVYDHFRKILTQRGIRPIESVGRRFDPTYHEALVQQPSDEHPPGTVIQELERGWMMHERVLRPARVIVSSGPALVPAGSEGDGNEVS